MTTAAEAIGPIEPGVEIFGSTLGDFSLIDIVEHCLEATGPARLTIGSWTAGLAHMERVAAYGDRIESVEWIMDRSYPRSHAAYAARMVELFGERARVLRRHGTDRLHAKYVLIESDRLCLSVRSSMNFNENPRAELFTISDDPRILEALADLSVESTPLAAAVQRARRAPRQVATRRGSL